MNKKRLIICLIGGVICSIMRVTGMKLTNASVMNSKWVHYTRPSQAFFSPCLFS